MSIVSSPFGTTTLNGEDAIKFLEQVNTGCVISERKAQESLARGRKILDNFYLKQNGEKVWVLN